VASYSEYGTLKRVVLGTAIGYKPSCWSWKTSDSIDTEKFKEAVEIASTAIPKEVIEQVEEDLTEYQKILESLGVYVYRPPSNLDEPIRVTDDYFSFGRDFYNIRDLHCVFGSKILSSAPSQPNRIKEIFDLKPFISDIAQELEMEMLVSPMPNLPRNPEFANIRDEQGKLISTENIIAQRYGNVKDTVWHRLVEDEVLFDAANLVRFGSSALFLISSTGNHKAFDWLRKSLPEVNFQATDVYRSSHIDSTILPLSEDTFLVNSVRVNEANLPPLLEGSKVLYFHEVEPVPQEEKDFHINYREPASKEIKALGFHSNLADISSPWAGLNVLSVNRQTVLVESRQTALMKLLTSNGYEVIPVQMRHPYTMLGGLHCTTLDVDRDRD
jgi:N-dimethylarginine dimethylaminohydrolase